MANAIKKISVQRGYDVTRYALNCFGGAGGQHACLVADSLGIKTVLIHPLSGLLSAYGMGLADIRATRQQAVEESFGEGAKRIIEELGAKLGGEASAEVEGQGVPRAGIEVHVRPHIRYAGTDTALEIPAGSLAEMKSAFEAAHKARFGFIDESKELVVEAVAVEAVGGASKFEEPEVAPDANTLPAPARKTRFFINGAWHDANVFLREGLKPGHTVEGPSIVIEPNQTIVVDDGWQAAVNSKNHLVLRRVKVLERTRAIGTEADPGDARDLQQSLHVDRRADGRDAPEHGLLGEHQGAARFLLRGVRRGRQPRRQCPAHAGASRLDGQIGRDRDAREQGKDQTRRRLCAERAL
jgi:5-oxoprolinase (ATP-hydrolysing)